MEIMKLKIAVLAGDGIGPEVTAEAVRVLRQVAEGYGHDFEFTERALGGAGIKQSGTPLPQETLNACLSSDSVLLGAVGSPEYDSLSSDKRPEAGLLNLRKALGAFANLRPTRCYSALGDCSPFRSEVVDNSDILIVRELLGGLYFGEPRGFTNGGSSKSAFNTMRYSTEEIERIAHIAFTVAGTRRCKVTSVDKANVLETSQLWREVVSHVGLGYPEITLEHLYVDACAMHLAMNPRRFDVILTENLFGDILSDEAAAIAGSIGMLASASLGGVVEIYEPVHGSAPDLSGLGVANPFGAIASAALLLRYTAHLEQEAQDIEMAITAVLDAGYRTLDLDRENCKYISSTADIGSLVIEAMAEAVDIRYAYHAV